jgi:glucose/arabinose dehydrogenase
VGAVQTGTSAYTDYTRQSPGICRSLTPADMPAPNLPSSVTNNSTLVPRASNQLPQVPAGFTVQLYATGLNNPRLLATAPNGDIFVAQPGANNVVVLRGVDSNGMAQTTTTFASGLTAPFGLAFYPAGATPQYIYVANVNSVVRFPYQNGDTTARGAAQTIVPSLPAGGHGTRTLAFTADNRLLVSVGSAGNLTNTDTDKSETNRADVLAYTPEGTFLKVYASGLRNAVGLTVDATGIPWVSVNERDGLGDNLPPDYVTHIQEDGFYGWPWYYIGANPDPRLRSITLSSHKKPLSPTLSCSRTSLRSRSPSTPAPSFLPSTKAISSGPHMAPGIGRCVEATSSSEYCFRTAKPLASTRTS